VYDAGCPSVAAARALLTHVLQEAGAPAVWTEWCTDDPACPESHRRLGSPTILVNGTDVAPGPHPWAPRQEGEGPRARRYQDGELVAAVPPSALVSAAVQRALGPDVV
jgi:hypothetical protein